MPRPLTQLDLEKALATSKKTQVAASEYSSLSSQSSVWRSPVEVQAAINGISKLFVSRVRNIQPDSRDSYQHDSEGDSE